MPQHAGVTLARRGVDLGLLPSDPWPPQPEGRRYRKVARLRAAFDVRRLQDPTMMRRAIDAMPTHQPGSRPSYVVTAVAHYAGLRPSEVVMLRRSSLYLPKAVLGTERRRTA